MSVRVVIPILVVLALAGPARAAGGGPLYIETSGAGVSVPGAPARFASVPAGDNTLLLRTRVRGGQVTGSRLLHGRIGIPAVAMDGTPGGLSADGSRLVLAKANMRFPMRRSQFAIVDAATLHVERFTLRGEWGFDAISPDGSSLYLTQYPFANDPGRYVVRRYDVGRARLAPGVIVDKRDPEEQMRGTAITRLASADGRWAYTLYDAMAGDGAPFIHALDTVGRRAFCIDLDDLTGYPDLYTLQLRPGPGAITVNSRNDVLATVDTKTMHATDGTPWRDGFAWW